MLVVSALLLTSTAAVITTGCVNRDSPDPLPASPAAGRAPLVSSGDAPADADLPTLDENSTLHDYLTYAALDNPGLKSAFDRWRAALEKVPQAKSLPDPKLSYTEYVQAVETRVGPQQWNVSLAQTFPWFGTLGLQGRAATHAAEVARHQYEAAKLKLLYQVKHVYYEYYYLGRAVAVTEENVQLLTHLESVARARYRAGEAPHSTLIRAQVELGKLQDHLRALRDLQEPVVARLNAALNRDSEAPVPWPKELPENDTAVTSEQLLEWLRQGNPELKALDFVALKEADSIALARKNRYPDITLGVTYISTDDALMPGTSESGKDPVLAMLSVNVPIWARKYGAVEREAKARLDSALNERRNRENSLVADLKMAWYNFRDAERKIALYEETLIPQADQGLKVTQEAFKTGQADFLDLIDAQRTLLEFQLMYERALVNRAQRLAELEMLVGREMPRSAAGD